MSELSSLGREGIAGLLEGLGHRLSPPFDPVDLEPIVGARRARPLADELNALGCSVEQLRWTLSLLEGEIRKRQQVSDRFELVWTGPKASHEGVRDTAVVVRTLFTSARRSVLVSSFVFAEGAQARAVFGPLAVAMERSPDLDVQLFLHTPRSSGDHRSDSELLRVFADRFRTAWPGPRLPLVFHDPRGLSERGYRPSLHAKCVVVDEQRALITSANFTEAAHERNIEVGVLLNDPTFALSLRDQFDALVACGDLKPVPGLSR